MELIELLEAQLLCRFCMFAKHVVCYLQLLLQVLLPANGNGVWSSERSTVAQMERLLSKQTLTPLSDVAQRAGTPPSKGGGIWCLCQNKRQRVHVRFRPESPFCSACRRCRSPPLFRKEYRLHLGLTNPVFNRRQSSSWCEARASEVQAVKHRGALRRGSQKNQADCVSSLEDRVPRLLLKGFALVESLISSKGTFRSFIDEYKLTYEETFSSNGNFLKDPQPEAQVLTPRLSSLPPDFPNVCSKS